MNPGRYTTLVIVALVALRLGCGWLFFREGSKKVDGGKFSSEPFLRDAKGPLAGMYLGMIPDPYGDDRQNLQMTREQWEYYYNEAGGHYDFDEQQMDEAQAAYDRAVAKLSYFLAETKKDRDENYLEAERIALAEREPTASVNFRRTWLDTHDQEINSELQGWLREIDAIWDGFQADIDQIAHDGLLDVGGKEVSQYDYYGPYQLPRPGAAGLSSGFADAVIPWFTLAVGVLLVLGLFTRVAAVGGSLFLLSVVASQPMYEPTAADTNYQIVLLLGLLVVAAVGAGRWGGLDYFTKLCWNKCCGRSNTTEAS